jgi:hypothetical protein
MGRGVRRQCDDGYEEERVPPPDWDAGTRRSDRLRGPMIVYRRLSRRSRRLNAEVKRSV